MTEDLRARLNQLKLKPQSKLTDYNNITVYRALCEIIGATALGAWLGYQLGTVVGIKVLWLVIGSLIGLVAGLYNLYRLTRS